MTKVLTTDKDILFNMWTTGVDREFSHNSFNVYIGNPFIEGVIELEFKDLEQAGLDALDIYDQMK